MDGSEYALRYEQAYDLLWSNDTYEHYLEMYIKTGDSFYMDRLLDKVTEEEETPCNL